MSDWSSDVCSSDLERPAGGFLDARAQTAEIEEQRLMGRGGAGAHDRPVAQDKVLHRRADPPRGIGREADVALRLEPAGSLQQHKGAFLDERSEEDTSELQSLMRRSNAVSCLK